MMFYSAGTKGFYSKEINDYIPDDAVEISQNYWLDLLRGQQSGKVITSDDSGNPVLADQSPPTQEQLVAMAEAKKEYLITNANYFMNSKQWPGKAAIGRLKGDELTQYGMWLDYLDALEAVDTSSAPDIAWPIPPVVQARQG